MKSIRSFEITELVALLAEQRDLCGRLAELAEGQRSSIVDNKPERLLEILAGRQAVLDRLGKLSQRLRPFRSQWREVRSSLDADMGREVDGLLSDTDDRMRMVLARDREDAELLSGRKTTTRPVRAGVRMNQLAGAAYRTGAGSC